MNAYRVMVNSCVLYEKFAVYHIKRAILNVKLANIRLCQDNWCGRWHAISLRISLIILLIVWLILKTTRGRFLQPDLDDNCSFYRLIAP